MDFIERKIVIGTIVSSEFLANIADTYKSDLLQSKISQKIANWCVSFYKKHKKAPQREIEDFIHILRKDRGTTDSDIEDVIEIIDSLSKEFESSSLNVSYITEEAFKYFAKNSIENLIIDVKNKLERDDVEGVKQQLTSYNMIEKPETKGVSPFDASIIDDAFSGSMDGIFGYSGAIGNLLNCEFYKESFFAYLAPIKRGKSWILMDNAIVALQSNLNVAFFQTGDMSQKKFIRRFVTSLTKCNYKERYCETHWSPIIDCVHNQNGKCSLDCRENNTALFENAKEKDIYKKDKEEIIEQLLINKKYKPCTACQINENKKYFRGTPCYQFVKEKIPLTKKRIKRFVKTRYKEYENNFKLCTYSTNSLTSSMIRTQLDSWSKHENWIPDVLIIDYADIMQADGRYMGKKEKSSDIFSNLRKLSQDYKLCLITATQADADAITRESLSTLNFSDDIDKLKHLTGLVALNQNYSEKEKGVMRLSKILTRDEESNINRQCKVLQNLWIGKPILTSYF